MPTAGTTSSLASLVIAVIDAGELRYSQGPGSDPARGWRSKRIHPVKPLSGSSDVHNDLHKPTRSSGNLS
jgi:hypothetical protein